MSKQSKQSFKVGLALIRENIFLALPLVLSTFAAIVVMVASVLYNGSFSSIRFSLNSIGILTLTALTFSITFSTAWLGIRTQIKKKHTPHLNVVFGVIWGSIAFALIAIATAFTFMPSPREFWRVFEFAFVNGFYLGGFFGPIVGGIVGYYLTRQNIE